MKKDEFIYYNIKEEIKNINKIYNDKIIIEKNNLYNPINKEYLLKDDNINLSDVLSAIRQARSKNVGISQRQISTQPQRIASNTPQPPAPIQQTAQQQNSIQPQAINVIKPTSVNNAGYLWSPTSSSGVIYKYNRGVIGIEVNGTKHEIIFDGTLRHHNEATAEIGLITNCPVKEKYANPFINGMEVSKQGTIIIQLEGDSILVYLPELISLEQYESLESEINPRSNFSTVAFSHGDDIYDDTQVDIEYLKNFYSKIVVATRRVSR